MDSINIKVNGLQVISFDPRSFQTRIKVGFLKNSEQKSIDLDYEATPADEFAEILMRKIRAVCKPEIDSDDILESIYSIRFLDEDRTLERISAFFSKVNDRLRSFKRETRFRSYIDMIQTIKEIKMNL